MSAALAKAAAREARQVASKVRLFLPEPPSVNALFRNVPGRGRAKTEAYRTWENAAGWEIAAQNPGRISGGYEMTIQLGPTRKDPSNVIKAAEDLIVSHGIIDDDRHARRIVIEANPHVPAKRIVVTIVPWEAE